MRRRSAGDGGRPGHGTAVMGKCGDAGQHGERRPDERSGGAGMALVTAGAEDCLRRRCRGRVAAAPSHTTGMQAVAHRAMADRRRQSAFSRWDRPAAGQSCRAEQDECPPHHGKQQGEQPIGKFSGKRVISGIVPYPGRKSAESLREPSHPACQSAVAGAPPVQADSGSSMFVNQAQHPAYRVGASGLCAKTFSLT